MNNQKKTANFPGNLSLLDVTELYRAANTHLVLEGITLADVASEAGTRTGRVYAYQDDDAATLNTVSAIITTQARRGAPFVLERLARDAGFLLVAAPTRSGSSCAGVIAASVAAMRETTHAVEIFGAAVSDGVVTKREALELQEAIIKGQAALAALAAMATELAEQEAPRREGGR